MLVFSVQPLHAEESDPPSLELLEFLGSSDGEVIEWADPSVVVMTAGDAERDDDRNDKQEDE